MAWSILSYNVKTGASDPCATAGGSVSITFAPVPNNQLWRVERLAILCPGKLATECLIYDQIPSPGIVPADGTRSGNFTVDDCNAPITIPGGGQLWVVFNNVTADTIGKVRVQYFVMSGTAQNPTPVAA
jgi:hypothetical protein